MYIEVLPYGAVLAAMFAIAYLIGFGMSRALLKQIGLQPFQEFFLNVFFGAVLLVVVFSAVKSGFRTANLLLLPILAMLYWEYKKLPPATPSVHSPKLRMVPWLAMLAIGTMVFVAKAALVYKGGNFPFVVSNGADYAQHALISEALASIGVENKFAPESILDERFRNLVPYHYFDLWLNALVASATGLNHYLLLEMATYPFFMILGAMGFLALWETQRQVGIGAILLAAIFIGFGSLHLDVYNHFHYLSKANYRLNHFGEAPFQMQKLLYYFPFVFAFGALILRARYVMAFLLLLALSTVYFSAIVLVALPLLFVLANLLRPLWVSRKEALALAGYVGVVLLCWVVLFKLFGQGLENSRDSFGLNLSDMAGIKTRINIMGLSVVQASVMYLPVVVGMVFLALGCGRQFYWNKEVLLLSALAASTFAVGLGAWVIAYENVDGMQLVGNNMPLANTLLLALMVYFVGKGALKSRAMFNVGMAVLVLVALVGVWAYAAKIPHRKEKAAAKYSESFLLQISDRFAGSGGRLTGVFLKGAEEYYHKEYWIAHRLSQSFRLIEPLVLMDQYSSTIHLSVLDMPISETPLEKRREENALKGQLFYKYVETQKEQGTFVGTEQSQLDFIKAYNIKYIFASKSAIIPATIEHIIDERIEDANTGTRFFIVKHPQ